MFSISVYHGQASTPLTFLFRTKEGAEAAYNSQTRTVWWSIEDDFGQKANFRISDVSSIFYEDMDLSKLATIERSLHYHRIDANVNTRAMADPALKPLMGGGGPAMISPGGLNGRMMGPG